MPKLKTRKSVSSRVQKSKNGKYLRRRAGQSHFNARDNGKATRRKRNGFAIANTEKKALRWAIPYA